MAVDELFTDEARQSIGHAQAAAADAGSDDVGTEHLLVGVLAEPTSAAARVGLDVGLSYERLVGHEPQAVSADVAAASPFSPEAKLALERAFRVRVGMGADRIDSSHVLRGLLETDSPGAKRLLVGAGLERAALLEAVRAVLDGRPPMASD